jgi:hypothetical protein
MAFLNGTDPGLRQTRTPTVDTFAAGVGFTAGSSTYVTLSVDCGTEASLITTFDGITQHRDTYSYDTSNRRVTFDAAIPTGVSKIECTYTTTIPATTPADGSVTQAKLGDEAVNEAKLQVSNAPTNGYFLSAQSGNTGGLTWAEAGGGKVLQVVSTTKTDTFSTTSDSFTDVTGLTVSITPAATSSKVLVIASVVWTNVGGTSHNFYGRLMRDSTVLHVGTGSIGSRVAASFGGDSVGVNSRNTSSINFLDSPSSTSAIAYHIEARSQTSGQAVYVNRSATDTDGLPYSRLASTVTAMEIGA